MAVVKHARSTSLAEIPIEDGKLSFVKTTNGYDIYIDASINGVTTRFRVSDSSLQSTLNAHINDTDNPHSLTAQQISAILGYTPVNSSDVSQAVASAMDNLTFSVNLTDGCLYWE
jgi:hypothetical protein